MKKITCLEAGHFEMQQSKKPLAAKGEVLVRIRRIGICGTDLHAFQGKQAFFSYPRVLGHELSGERSNEANQDVCHPVALRILGRGWQLGSAARPEL